MQVRAPASLAGGIGLGVSNEFDRVNHLLQIQYLLEIRPGCWLAAAPLPQIFIKGRRQVQHSRRIGHIAVETEHHAELCLADAHRILQHRIEHWRQRPRRAADHLQHFGGGCLLLQRFPQFLEQPRVLDGDDGLPSEVRDQLNLLVGERPHLLADHRERANQFIVLEQRNRENGPIAGGHASDHEWMVLGRQRPDIGDLDHFLGDCEAPQWRVRWWSQQRIAGARLDVGGGVVVCGNHAKGISVAQVEISEDGLTDARRIRQHGLEHGLQFAWRA